MIQERQTFSLRSIALPAFGPSVLFGTGEGAIFPIVALSAHDLGASTAVASLIVALFTIGSLLANLPAASLATRFGERRAMVGAAAFSLLGVLLCLAANTVWLLGLGVFMVGLASAVFLLARQAFLIEAVPPSMRARAMSTLGGTMRIGMFVGPFAAAAFIHFLGIRGAYWAAALAMIGAGALSMLVPDLEVRKGEATIQAIRLSLFELLRLHARVLLTLGLTIAVVAAVRACRQVVIPLWAVHVGLDASAAALIYGIMGAMDMLLFYPAGKIMDTYGRRWVTIPCMLVLGATFALMPLSTGFASLLAISMVMGMGNGIGSGIMMTVGADASPREGRTHFLGIWRLISDSGGCLGPLLLSGATALFSLGAGIVLIGALGFLGAGMFWRWQPHRPQLN